MPTSILAAEEANQQGIRCAKSSDLSRARERFVAAIEWDPDYAEAHNNLGITLAGIGDRDGAIRHLRQALKLRPDYPEALNNLGNVLINAGRVSEAQNAYENAIRIFPEYVEAFNNLGNAYARLGRHADAVRCYDRAILLKDDYFEAYNNRANALRTLGKTAEAVADYNRALELHPSYPEAMNNLAIVYADDRKHDRAIELYEQALSIRNDYPEALNNLGNVLADMGRFADAVTAYERAIELMPDYSDAYSNMANALRAQDRFSEAFRWYDDAIRRQPKFGDAYLNRGLLNLLLGHFEAGWEDYEWRWKIGAARPRFPNSLLWDGSPLAGKRILLHAEQGLGDTIQFVRYCPLVQRLGGHVILECPGSLLDLLSRSPGVDQWIPRGAEFPDFDVHLPLLSVPRLLRTNLSTIPCRVPYVFPEAGRLAKWGERLKEYDGFRVGIAWQGNPRFKSDAHRSIPLASLDPLLGLEKVKWIALQKGHGREQIESLPVQRDIVDLGEEIDIDRDAFVDTAAIIPHLDLFITSDTAIAHVAGAMGAEVWLLLSAVADWRWLHRRNSSPWYPTMKIFRQDEFGDWGSLATSVRDELVCRLTTDSGLGRMAEQRWSAKSLNRMGIEMASSGHQAEAVAIFRFFGDTAPKNSDAHNNEGVVLLEMGKPEPAVSCFQRAIALNPTNAKAHNNLGNALAACDRYDEAIEAYGIALDIDSEYAEAHNNLGNAQLATRRFAASESSYLRAIQLSPDYAEAHHNLGICLGEQGKARDAIEAYRLAIQLKPQYGRAMGGLASALMEEGRYEEAEKWLRDSLSIDSGNVEHWIRLSRVLRNLGRVEEAVDCAEEAVRVNPRHEGSYLCRADLRLLQGDFRRGFEDLQRRSRGREGSALVAQWTGSNLEGRTVRVEEDGGLEETLLLLRFLPTVEAFGGRVRFDCRPNLLRILGSFGGADQGADDGDERPLSVALSKLPAIAGASLASLPIAPALGAGIIPDTRLRMGRRVVMVAGEDRGNEHWRQFPIDSMVSMANRSGDAHCYMLRKVGNEIHVGKRQDGVSDVSCFTFDVAEDLSPLVACLLAADELILFDDAIAHLAGLLRRTGIVLVGPQSSWCWHVGRSDSPWYPTLRLLRCHAGDSWSEALKRFLRDDREGKTTPLRDGTASIRVSAGELLDRVTILRIKQSRIEDAEKRKNTEYELSGLVGMWDEIVASHGDVPELASQLSRINERLWDIEDELREKEEVGDFGAEFVSCARSVYKLNDERAAIKRRINGLVGSDIFEEKSYRGA